MQRVVHTFSRQRQCDDPPCKPIGLAFSRGIEGADNLGKRYSKALNPAIL